MNATFLLYFAHPLRARCTFIEQLLSPAIHNVMGKVWPPQLISNEHKFLLTN